MMGSDRTREWYVRRAERAEELADHVLSPRNRNRLLHVAAHLRTKADSASRGAPQPLAEVRGADVWRCLAPRLGFALSAIAVFMRMLDVMC